MESKIYDLREYHVYQLGNLLVEASYCEVWTLIVLNSKGEYISKQHGALVAFQLRDDGVWDSLYHSCAKRASGEETWTIAYGDTVHIDQPHLKHVADSRLYVQAEYLDQQLDRQFREIMSVMGW